MKTQQHQLWLDDGELFGCCSMYSVYVWIEGVQFKLNSLNGANERHNECVPYEITLEILFSG